MGKFERERDPGEPQVATRGVHPCRLLRPIGGVERGSAAPPLRTALPDSLGKVSPEPADRIPPPDCAERDERDGRRRDSKRPASSRAGSREAAAPSSAKAEGSAAAVELRVLRRCGESAAIGQTLE